MVCIIQSLAMSIIVQSIKLTTNVILVLSDYLHLVNNLYLLLLSINASQLKSFLISIAKMDTIYFNNYHERQTNYI